MATTHVVLKELLALNDTQKNEILETLVKENKNAAIREALQEGEKERLKKREVYIQQRKDAEKQKLLTFIETFNTTYAKHKHDPLFTYLQKLRHNIYDEVYTFLYYLVRKGSIHWCDKKKMSYSQDFSKDRTKHINAVVNLLLPGATVDVRPDIIYGVGKVYTYSVIWSKELSFPDYAKILFCSNESQGLNYDEKEHLFEFNEEEFDAIDYGKDYDRYFPKVA